MQAVFAVCLALPRDIRSDDGPGIPVDPSAI